MCPLNHQPHRVLQRGILAYSFSSPFVNVSGRDFSDTLDLCPCEPWVLPLGKCQLAGEPSALVNGPDSAINFSSHPLPLCVPSCTEMWLGYPTRTKSRPFQATNWSQGLRNRPTASSKPQTPRECPKHKWGPSHWAPQSPDFETRA
jgi:hypothetical protein